MPTKEMREEKELVKRYWQILKTTRERQIVRSRYGIAPYRRLTLQGIAIDFGISRERARQILLKAMEKMRQEQMLRSVRNIAEVKIYSDGVSDEDFAKIKPRSLGAVVRYNMTLEITQLSFDQCVAIVKSLKIKTKNVTF